MLSCTQRRAHTPWASKVFEGSNWLSLFRDPPSHQPERLLGKPWREFQWSLKRELC